ncbi:DivIVA domain-containing protein [Propionibacterium sp. oral taxon 192 str. F0372]|uniref:DivIVA domain-containing protein n=1 Tax=Propionibacterium sp. oral taxon 192 TaxID=671222 RepID=UPI000353B3E0|nr:DivIVA domain-containing protein [Propionibacterium sp. oral taxon 192]EPH02497.1 DivIVA domain-containing protein [Propionibacterium sp. oral taxon 192 str. F0372]
MGWIFAAVMVVVIAVFFVIGTGHGGELAPQLEDRPVPDAPIPDDLGPYDLSELRFAVVTRGYSMAQVDALLDRVSQRWQEDLDQIPVTTAPETNPSPVSGSGQAEQAKTPSWQHSAEPSVDAE